MISKAQPKFPLPERRQTVDRQIGRQPSFVADLGDFPQEQRPHLKCADAACQAIASLLDAERRAAGYHDTDGARVHKELQLWRPGIQVLDFIQEKKNGLPFLRGLVERFAQNRLLKPIGQAKNRLL